MSIINFTASFIFGIFLAGLMIHYINKPLISSNEREAKMCEIINNYSPEKRITIACREIWHNSDAYDNDMPVVRFCEALINAVPEEFEAIENEIFSVEE